MPRNFDDVKDFHQKFGLPAGSTPSVLTTDLAQFRIKFMHEELREFEDSHETKDLAGCADALIDLAYVVMGTAVMMGLPWERLWDEVHNANMRKVRVASATESKRNSSFDVKKPPGWVPPDIVKVLSKSILDAMEETPRAD